VTDPEKYPRQVLKLKLLEQDDEKAQENSADMQIYQGSKSGKSVYLFEKL